MATRAKPMECHACTARLCRLVDTAHPPPARRILELARGERVASASGARARFWTVLSGTAAICHMFSDGRRQISAIERPGATIGGPMARDDSPMWLEALEPSRICEIDLSAEVAALRDNPAFLRVMFDIVHGRLEATTRHLTMLGRLDSTERVTLFLAETAARAPGPGPVHLALSREDIADHLGLNTETVSRIFSKLRKSGLFTFLSPTEYTVSDPEALARNLPMPVAGPRPAPMNTLPPTPPR